MQPNNRHEQAKNKSTREPSTDTCAYKSTQTCTQGTLSHPHAHAKAHAQARAQAHTVLATT